MSLNETEIKDLIEAKLQGSRVVIQGDGRHFEAYIISDEFKDKSMLQQHRIVNTVLSDSFKTDAIHALSFKTFTPDQWDSRSNG